MSSNPHESPRQLPEHPDLRHLKDQAKDLLRAGQAASLADAQLQIARHYGNNGPLTWVAECRVPRQPPSEVRLAMALWLIERGADVNANAARDTDGFGGHTPLFHTAVTLASPDDSKARLLLDHGANPNARATIRKQLRQMGNPDREIMCEFHNVTPIGYASQFQQPAWVNDPAIAAIAEHGGTA